MFFLATSHTKNTISEKTLKHTIQLIYPKKRYEHTLFSNVIIIAFTHKNNKQRDFSLRKKVQRVGSVYIIEEIILYYSTCKKEFWVTPKFDEDTKAQGKRCIIGPFKQRSNGKIIYKDNYMISLTERTCSCGSSQEFRKGFI